MIIILNYHEKAVKFLNHFQWLPPLFARMTLGFVFIESGWGKIHNIPKVVEFFTSLGIPTPQIQAPLVAGVEFICGVLILIGLMTRLASIPLAVTMIVAILTAKREEIQSFTDVFGFSEFLYIILFFWLLLSGAGLISIDSLVLRKCRKSV